MTDLRKALAQGEQGCAECGVKESDGYALYCVACAEEFVGGYKENVPVHTSELLTQVSTDNHDFQISPKPEQKPVGYVENRNLKWCNGKTFGDMDKVDGYRLYTAPPKQAWVGLTDEEILIATYELRDVLSVKKIIKSIEAKLKEKNT